MVVVKVILYFRTLSAILTNVTPSEGDPTGYLGDHEHTDQQPREVALVDESVHCKINGSVKIPAEKMSALDEDLPGVSKSSRMTSSRGN